MDRGKVAVLTLDRTPTGCARSCPRCARRDPISRLDTAEQVHSGLARLSADHRAILTAIFIDELTYEHAAARLGVPLGTVKSRVLDALRALRAQVDQASTEQPCRRSAE
jgi:DNA-directed RNA polymerase specialized sigma24 family protein